RPYLYPTGPARQPQRRLILVSSAVATAGLTGRAAAAWRGKGVGRPRDRRTGATRTAPDRFQCPACPSAAVALPPPGRQRLGGAPGPWRPPRPGGDRGARVCFGYR